MLPTLVASLLHSALLLLCGFRSFKALESERGEDDTKWLTFWFVYTCFTFTKSLADYVAFAVPFYEEAMIGIVVYLAFFGGAKLAYASALPLLKKHEVRRA